MNKEIKKTRRGGFRPGAGRKPAVGAETTVMRIPITHRALVQEMIKQRKQLLEDLDTVTQFSTPALNLSALELPLYLSKVPAGFPSPADDYVEDRIDLNRLLVTNKDATFYAHIASVSMIDAGLLPGHKAIIDRSRSAKIGDKVLACVDGAFTMKILGRSKEGNPILLPANSTGKFKPIEIKEGMQFSIEGVITGTFCKF